MCALLIDLNYGCTQFEMWSDVGTIQLRNTHKYCVRIYCCTKWQCSMIHLISSHSLYEHQSKTFCWATFCARFTFGFGFMSWTIIWRKKMKRSMKCGGKNMNPKFTLLNRLLAFRTISSTPCELHTKKNGTHINI